MDVKGNGGVQKDAVDDLDLRRGPWTVDEDLTLINYIATHGEGRWNSLARSAGLKRTGKSCRLRWLNYLRPDVRRGNITLEEQLLILELHSRWGNRWSKIAQYLPGRTDNEIKNYWRTRVQKHAKQLKCDVNSKQFKDTMRYLWMPRLVERIQAAAAAAAAPDEDSQTNFNTLQLQEVDQINNFTMLTSSTLVNNNYPHHDNSSTPASSDSFDTQISDYNNNYTTTLPTPNYYQPPSSHITTPSPFFSQPFDFNSLPNNSSIQPPDTFDNFWNLDNILFLQQHLDLDAII